MREPARTKKERKLVEVIHISRITRDADKCIRGYSKRAYRCERIVALSRRHIRDSAIRAYDYTYERRKRNCAAVR